VSISLRKIGPCDRPPSHHASKPSIQIATRNLGIAGSVLDAALYVSRARTAMAGDWGGEMPGEVLEMTRSHI